MHLLPTRRPRTRPTLRAGVSARSQPEHSQGPRMEPGCRGHPKVGSCRRKVAPSSSVTWGSRKEQRSPQGQTHGAGGSRPRHQTELPSRALLSFPPPRLYGPSGTPKSAARTRPPHLGRSAPCWHPCTSPGAGPLSCPRKAQASPGLKDPDHRLPYSPAASDPHTGVREAGRPGSFQPLTEWGFAELMALQPPGSGLRRMQCGTGAVCPTPPDRHTSSQDACQSRCALLASETPGDRLWTRKSSPRRVGAWAPAPPPGAGATPEQQAWPQGHNASAQCLRAKPSLRKALGEGSRPKSSKQGKCFPPERPVLLPCGSREAPEAGPNQGLQEQGAQGLPAAGPRPVTSSTQEAEGPGRTQTPRTVVSAYGSWKL